MTEPQDPRLRPVEWAPTLPSRGRLYATRLLVLCNLVFATRYLIWLFHPGRSAQVVLYGLLVGAEAYNLLQGIGFWWTISHLRHREVRTGTDVNTAVDVFIPTYNEPLEVVEPTVVAAMRLEGAEIRVALLDDGRRPEMEEMARRLGARYIARPGSEGAKAGNINWALHRTDAPFVAILDCDHVPDRTFVRVCLAYFDDADVAFVQTPQYYANWRQGGVAEASWSQQALFFGTIAVGRDQLGAMFCCGTNVVFRRDALDAAGGFSLDSLTEDFELSVRLHEAGWTSRYVPKVLASGLGPEDMASYVTQQMRWARGCLAALPRVITARLPFRLRLQYLLAGAYWLTGWTLMVYMTFPVVRILTGEQPVHVKSAEEFLIHWLPYFAGSMATVAITARGRYTYPAFALMTSIFWVHVVSSLLTVLRRKGSFKVTPKHGSSQRQLRPVIVPLAVAAALGSVALYGLLTDQSPATITNVAFALVHITVLCSGAGLALARPRPDTAELPELGMELMR